MGALFLVKGCREGVTKQGWNGGEEADAPSPLTLTLGTRVGGFLIGRTLLLDLDQRTYLLTFLLRGLRDINSFSFLIVRLLTVHTACLVSRFLFPLSLIQLLHR